MKPKKNNVHYLGIIGCGWLGLTLATELISSGYSVKGTTTTKAKLNSLKKSGVLPFYVELGKDENNLPQFLSGCKSLIINIPPSLRSGSPVNYLKKLRILKGSLSASKAAHVVFVSSTSVYLNTPKMQTVAESEGPFSESDKAKTLIEAENIFRESKEFATTVIRFGGLIGSDRHPAKYLSGKSDLKNPNAPVNLIHKSDCINLIKTILDIGNTGEIYNGVYPDHPSRKDYYTSICKYNNLPLPSFNEQIPSLGKKVSSKRSLRLDKFKYRNGIYDHLEP